MNRILVLLIVIPFSVAALAARSHASGPKLEATWSQGILTSWEGEALKRERAKNGRVQLATLAEDALKPLSANEKSRLDWVIVHLAQAPQIWVPWAALKTLKMEVTVPALTLKVSTSGAAADLPYSGIALWEGQQVTRLEFGNVRDRLGSWYLEQRTDPIALRGEKLFVQGCATCHAQGNRVGLGDLKIKLRALSSQKFAHPSLDKIRAGARPIVLTDRDSRALSTYVQNSTP